MLMGFVRTASTKALSGIPIKRAFVTGLIVRPLLCVTKADIVAYCEMNDITPRMDPSNQDDRYTRNYFRNHIIPLIKGENDNIHATVQSLSESLQEEDRKSTRLNSSHVAISYAVFCLKKKKTKNR